jgi:transcriptional regulator of arginine metabolism
MNNYASTASASQHLSAIIRGAMKRIRHQAILELVKSGKIASQDDLIRGLQSRRIDVSQSTLSRDIQELRLAKAGGAYVLVEPEAGRVADDSLPRIVQEFVTGVDVAYNLVIIKTGSGNASTVSQALDEADLPEAAGSLAGENTIFIATKSAKDARKLEKRLRDLL